MSYEDVYTRLLFNIIDKNYEELGIEILPDIEDKLKSWSLRHSVSFNLTKYNYYTNEFFRHEFVKDPKKQNLASIAFILFIKSCFGNDSIIVLPNGGKDALYCLNGMIIKFDDGASVHKSAKTIDFVMKDSKERNIYISHKRTDGANGGAQANQMKDAISFLEQATYNNNPKNIFIAVLDGDFYKDRIDDIEKRFYRVESIYVCNSDTLVNKIFKILNEKPRSDTP